MSAIQFKNNSKMIRYSLVPTLSAIRMAEPESLRGDTLYYDFATNREASEAEHHLHSTFRNRTSSTGRHFPSS